MSLQKTEIIALKNALDCLDHYMLIDHVQTHYNTGEWEIIENSIECLQQLVNRQSRQNSDTSDTSLARLNII